MNGTKPQPAVRIRRIMRGIVQGVGFRPTVARWARDFPVTGFVGNDDAGVFIEAQGETDAVRAFFAALDAGLPALARVDSVSAEPIGLVEDEQGFRIVASGRSSGAVTLIPPDVAPCPDCLRELADPADRRYGYPFISCTNCGPRLSIIVDVPYDRPLTTMAGFPMCPACAAEYAEATDRRFHAQPISCFDCGPTLWLEAAGAPVVPPPLDGPARRAAWAQTIEQAQRLLDDGAILAVKGIGGFTLFADARNPDAVARLRARKHRPDKPFATMCADLASARAVADVDDEAGAAMTGPQRPIVLVPKSADYDLADSVAPRLDQLGIMLPSAPLHVLLVRPGDCFVATSGNLSGEPLACDNDDARSRLGRIADHFLMHDRPIHVSVEDSVLLADGPQARVDHDMPPTDRGLSSTDHDLSQVGRGLSHTDRDKSPSAGTIVPIRRSRGYAPLPVRLGDADASVLAVGAELKNTFAIVRDGMAFLSPHLGDMEALPAQRAFAASVAQLSQMHRRTPQLIVADKHPGYASSAWAARRADELDVPLLLVQHHHAHALSLLAEHAALGKTALVAALDGTGYGDDGAVWGGEIIALSANPLEHERVWHLPGFWLAGGDTAVRRPWKLAAALLDACGLDDTGLASHDAGDPAERRLVASQLSSHLGCVWTTSAGRIFDAVASMLGLCQQQTYEGQAGTELEAAARRCPHPWHAWEPEDAELTTLIAAVADGFRAGVPVACLAAGFHRGFADLVADALLRAAGERRPDVLGLSGGVAQNRLLSGRLRERVGTMLTHRVVPANDGGLSLGQALAGYLTVVGR